MSFPNPPLNFLIFQIEKKTPIPDCITREYKIANTHLIAFNFQRFEIGKQKYQYHRAYTNKYCRDDLLKIHDKGTPKNSGNRSDRLGPTTWKYDQNSVQNIWIIAKEAQVKGLKFSSKIKDRATIHLKFFRRLDSQRNYN